MAGSEGEKDRKRGPRECEAEPRAGPPLADERHDLIVSDVRRAAEEAGGTDRNRDGERAAIEAAAEFMALLRRLLVGVGGGNYRPDLTDPRFAELIEAVAGYHASRRMLQDELLALGDALVADSVYGALQDAIADLDCLMETRAGRQASWPNTLRAVGSGAVVAGAVAVGLTLNLWGVPLALLGIGANMAGNLGTERAARDTARDRRRRQHYLLLAGMIENILPPARRIGDAASPAATALEAPPGGANRSGT